MIHSEYRAVLEVLQKHKIQFCVLRDELQHGQLVNDLDLLVQSHKFDLAIQVLEQSGYRLRTTESQLPFKSVLVRMAKGRFVVIDLHRTIVQNAMILLDGDAVISRMPSDSTSYLPAPADLLVILLLHNIVGKKLIQEKHLGKIKQLKERVDNLQIRSILRDDELASVIFAVLADLDRHFSDQALVRMARDRLMRRYRVLGGLGWRAHYRHRLRRLMQYFNLRPRAPLYALTGVDGAGKSSLAEELLLVLNQPGGFRAVIIYMGPWGHYKLRWMSGELFVPGWSVDMKEWLSCMFGRNSENRPSTLVAVRILVKIALRDQLSDMDKDRYLALRRHSRLFVSLRFIRSMFAATRFVIMITAEMYYRYFLVYRQRRRGVTVIADRYIYDLMTGRMHEMIPQYRRIRTFLCNVFPRPTRGFLVSNDAETILSRKADLSEAMLHKYLHLYEELAEEFGFEKISTNRPARELALELVEQCFDEIIKHAKV